MLLFFVLVFQKYFFEAGDSVLRAAVYADRHMSISAEGLTPFYFLLMFFTFCLMFLVLFLMFLALFLMFFALFLCFFYLFPYVLSRE